jgi:hypothetical protein
MTNVLFQSIFAPLRVFNRGFVKSRIQTSIVTVIITALVGSVVAPVIYFYTYRSRYEIHMDISSMFLGLTVSIITWLATCTLFWILSKAFNKGIGFGQVASTWGLSYIPNFLCVILYNLLLIKPEIYNGSGFSSFIISSLFIMFLIWKSIYYFMFMRFMLNTTLLEIIVITAVSALLFGILMIIGFKVGIQVPML